MNQTELNLKDDDKKESKSKLSESKATKDLIFVVQKHQASHLHFDFRLETDGVLKSWAIPKGPSMNSSDKRLAIMVEDHPLDYAGFEGEIPKGNYGAGIVEIWDSGTWQPNEKFNNVQQALKDGLLEFTVKGKKLKGEFALVKMKRSSAKNAWLLVKKQDQYASGGAYNAMNIKGSE